MSEKVIKSVRAVPEVFERLNTLAKAEGLDQGATLEALLNAWDVQAAKNQLPGRAADIADFDASIQSIQRAFLRSLELASTAEQRARVTYAAQLDAMSGTVARLEKELEECKAKREENAKALILEIEARKRAEAEAEELRKGRETDTLLAAIRDQLGNLTPAKTKTKTPPKISTKTENGTTKEANLETGEITEKVAG